MAQQQLQAAQRQVIELQQRLQAMESEQVLGPSIVCLASASALDWHLLAVCSRKDPKRFDRLQAAERQQAPSVDCVSSGHCQQAASAPHSSGATIADGAWWLDQQTQVPWLVKILHMQCCGCQWHCQCWEARHLGNQPGRHSCCRQAAAYLLHVGVGSKTCTWNCRSFSRGSWASKASWCSPRSRLRCA